MAITRIAEPLGQYNTGYNPTVFAVDSDNKGNTGFRYLFNIFSAGTSDLLASYKIAPRIGDGYGILFAERALNNYLTYNFSASTIPQSWVGYTVEVGESYGSNWSYNDYQFYSNTGSTFNAYTELYNTATTHSYTVGDQISITQSDEPTPAFPSLSGLHTIVEVPDANSIVVDLVYVYANPGIMISGDTVFADNSRINYPNLYNFEKHYAINGAVPFTTKYLDNNIYVISGSTGDKKFMTTTPRTSTHTRTEDMFTNFISNFSTVPYYLRIVNSNGDVFRKFIADNTQPMLQVKSGPNNIGSLPITIISGSLPVVKNTTTSYEFWITDSTNQQISEKIIVNIDDRCPINYGTNNGGDISICFLDRLGSFGSFAFQLKKQDSTSIKRDMYYRQFGDVVNGTWDYNLTDVGDSVYNVELNRQVTLNTNWMTEADAQYFDELVSSPVTFVKWNGVYLACTINDNQTERSYQKNKTLMRKTITIAFANNDTINI